MMANKVKYGLKNVTDGEVTITYGTPVPIPGAVNIALDAAGESVQFYADDSIYFEENINDGYTGNLEMALIPDDFRTDVLGEIEDSKGALIEKKDVQAKRFALLFEFDAMPEDPACPYYVLASRPGVSGTGQIQKSRKLIY